MSAPSPMVQRAGPALARSVPCVPPAPHLLYLPECATMSNEGSSTVEIPKPTAAARTLFDSLVPSDERVEVKPMFGNLGAFVNGNMFMGLFGPDIGLKLSAADEADLRGAGGGPFGPAERPMG